MDWVPINFNLIKNPLNWFTVFFMFLLPAIVLTLLYEKAAGHE